MVGIDQREARATVWETARYQLISVASARTIDRASSHRVFLDDAWASAFRALGKTPTGWSTFIPANFVVGILMVWLYARLHPRYGGGPKTALRSGLAAWAVFWVIPMLAIMPMDLFPNSLLASVIALGFVDANLAVLLGAWLYKAR
jgi:hypothetical protein